MQWHTNRNAEMLFGSHLTRKPGMSKQGDAQR